MFRYFEGDPARRRQREHRVSSKHTRPGPAGRAAQQAGRPSLRATPSSSLRRISRSSWPSRWSGRRCGRWRREHELAQGTYYLRRGRPRLVCLPVPRQRAGASRTGCGGRSDPVHLVRGLYMLGGNAYGHQKQYGWGCGLGMPADVFDDVTVGFSPGTHAQHRARHRGPRLHVPLGRGRRGPRRRGLRRRAAHGRPHPAARAARRPLRLRRGQLVPVRRQRQPDQEHPLRQPSHLGEQLLPAGHVRHAGAVVGPVLLQQRGAELHLRRPRRRGRGGLREPDRPQQPLRHRQGQLVTFRGSDRGYVFNNTTFRGGGIWFHSEPERANATEQGQPTLRPELPDRPARAGALAVRSSRSATRRAISLDVRWHAAGRPAGGLLLRELGLPLAAADRRQGLRRVPGGGRPGRDGAGQLLPRSGGAAAVPAADRRQPAALGGRSGRRTSRRPRRCAATWSTR